MQTFLFVIVVALYILGMARNLRSNRPLTGFFDESDEEDWYEDDWYYGDLYDDISWSANAEYVAAHPM